MQTCTYSTDCAGCVTYADPLLRIENVYLSYGDKLILRDLSATILDVRRRCHIQGQIVGLLGPSGIGKTQLFRIMAGLQKPTSGQVYVNAEREPVRAGMVGVVSQTYTLFEHRTVLGNLMLGARQRYPEKEAKERAVGLLDRFQILDKASVYPAQLSGGQRQRVAIIQQLLCSEHFLLMDEPFSGLDPMNVDRVCALLTEVSCLDELNTVIVVSHDVTATASVADHLWLIGRDRDAAGNLVPGARIQETYDLVDRGLCWQEHIQTRPDFVAFVREVKERFRTL